MEEERKIKQLIELENFGEKELGSHTNFPRNGPLGMDPPSTAQLPAILILGHLTPDVQGIVEIFSPCK